MNKQTNIIPDKYYSIRQAAQLIPWIHCEPTLQKMIHYDVENNNNQLFKVIILKRHVQKRYFVKGENIINIIAKADAGELIQNGSTLRSKEIKTT